MAWYEKEWWHKLVGKKESHKKFNAVDSIAAIVDFLKDVENDTKFLEPELNKLRELEKERTVTSDELSKTNLETQEDLLNKILERYEFFQTDVDINGLRLKKVAAQFLKNAKKAGLKHLVEEKNNDKRWRFLW